MLLWRISNHVGLRGEGGLAYSARWHTAGRPIVYLAESAAGSLLEALVHLELHASTWPAAYNLLRVEVPRGVRTETIRMGADARWAAEIESTRALGDAWLRAGRTALARVPSAIIRDTWNVLLNPAHAAAKAIRVVEASRQDYDPRLLAG